MIHLVSHSSWVVFLFSPSTTEYAPVSLLPRHVLNREYSDILIMGKNERSGSRCQGGVHTQRRLMRQEGDGEDRGAATPGRAPRLGRSRAFDLRERRTLSTSLYTVRGRGMLQVGLWGYECWRRRSSRLDGVERALPVWKAPWSPLTLNRPSNND